jgi:hypothetical protein
VVRDVDWEEERRRAVASLREQTEREAGYLTFSLDDVIEKPLPEEPGPARSVFDTPKRGGPAIMRPGRSGTRLGRFVSSLCDITGGISLFGVATACADSNVPRNLFESIKPEYLKKRPAELAARPAAARDMQELAEVEVGRDMQDSADVETGHGVQELADVEAGPDIQDAGALQNTTAGF